jgi:hypothetical protein
MVVLGLIIELFGLSLSFFFCSSLMYLQFYFIFLKKIIEWARGNSHLFRKGLVGELGENEREREREREDC